MIQLRQATQGEWDLILRDEISRYAEDHLRTGNWSKDDALQWAQGQYEKMLPHGVATKGHHIFILIEENSNEAVGFIWYEERLDASTPHAFLCNLHIFEPFRRQGYAMAALAQLEAMLRESRKLKRLQLHVFGHNHAARKLYAKQGFAETNVMMAKDIDRRKKLPSGDQTPRSHAAASPPVTSCLATA